ncbi:MAG: glycosyltransferase [Bacteroidales bacterium]|nr:glycosyltransferase [Bacteroidales bacterium]
MQPYPEASVLMPVFNAESTLIEALESLSGQTFPGFEILAIDDGSTDQSLSILESWAQHDNRLRILKTPHRGILGTLNEGLLACRAPLVARMDADDRSLPGRLEHQIARFRAYPDLSLVSSQVRAFPDHAVRQGLKLYLDWQNSLLDEAAIHRDIFIESPFVHPSVMYRRDAVVRLGGYQEHGWPEDYDLWMRMYLANLKFAKLPAVLLEWREGDTRLTRTDPRYSKDNFLRLKAHYLARGPLADRQEIFVWGAGNTGKKLCRFLLKEGITTSAFVDIDPRKIGRKLLAAPILAPNQLPEAWAQAELPVLIAAVGTRGARPLIQTWLDRFGLRQGLDWWFSA